MNKLFKLIVNDTNGPLCITFQGFFSDKIGKGVDNLPYYMYNTSKKFCNLNFLFIKDLHQIWYHGGINGNGEISEFLDIIKEILNNNNFKSIYTIGSSAGGYASILFGCLLKANKAIAIDPQTIIGNKSCIFSNNIKNFPGWFHRRHYLNNLKESKYYDLNNIIININVDIYCNKIGNNNYQYDNLQIMHLKNNSGNHLVNYINANGNSHGEISSEEIDKIFNEILVLNK